MSNCYNHYDHYSRYPKILYILFVAIWVVMGVMSIRVVICSVLLGRKFWVCGDGSKMGVGGLHRPITEGTTHPLTSYNRLVGC